MVGFLFICFESELSLGSSWMFLEFSGSISKSPASAPSGNLLEMPIIRPISKSTGSESLPVDSCPRQVKPVNHCSKNHCLFLSFFRVMWETQRKPTHRPFIVFSQGSLWYLSCANCFLIVSLLDLACFNLFNNCSHCRAVFLPKIQRKYFAGRNLCLHRLFDLEPSFARESLDEFFFSF